MIDLISDSADWGAWLSPLRPAELTDVSLLCLTSLVLLAHQIGPMIRADCMIENGLHWVLDMIFRDDE